MSMTAPSPDSSQTIPIPDSDLTFAYVLAQQAQVRPTAVAIVANDESMTYAHLHERVLALCGVLERLGLRRGDRLALLSENRLEASLVMLAAVSMGVVVAPLNWRLSARGLTSSLEMVAPAAILVSRRFQDAVAGSSTPVFCIDDDPPPWRGLVGPAADPALLAKVRGEDIATIMSTSGSTGTPKGVAISHRALVSRALLIHRELGIDDTDAFLGWAPTFHISSTDYLFATGILGGTYVVLPGFDAAAIADELVRRRVGWLMLMPGLISEVLAALGDRPVAGLRCVGAMADLVPPDQLRSLTQRLSTQYVNSFGSTEAGLVPGASFVEFPESGPLDLGKRPTRHCQYRVVDPDGHDVPLGGVGELLLRGPTLFSGYWSATGLNRSDFVDGWFHTGDLVRHREGPLLDFVDRATYMIKTGGENVYPAVIEREFQRHPEVVSVATIPMPHPKLHTVLSAFVSLRSPSVKLSDVIDACWANLASFERPHAVHLIHDSAFVRGVTGKIDRAALARLEHQCGPECYRKS